MSTVDIREVCHVAERYLEALGTPVALGVYLRMKYGEWDQLAAKRTDPRTYTADLMEKFRRDYLATELLRKYPGLPIQVDRVRAAKDAFWAAEAQCARTNVRLKPYVDDPLSEDVDVRIQEFIRDVRKMVGDILGPLPADLEARFGPGATFETRNHPCRANLTLGDKWELGIQCTPSATDYTKFLYETAWGRSLVREFGSRSALVYQRGNRFFTVPKDATIERGACAEPGGNVSLQLAVGRILRERLRVNARVDLVRGQEIHGSRMAAASLKGDYATIDLSSASDTICRNLVKLLLPWKWWRLLCDLRSPLTEIDGKWVYLEKFSSMGNGFTFELETLIFLALCRVVCGPRADEVLVFGDDIIVPNEFAHRVLAVLRFFGFTPNDRKTFTSGNFRESCGTDAFAGTVIKAFRWDSEPVSPLDWVSVHNGIRRALKEFEKFDLHHVLRAVERKLPSEIRSCTGPEELGDIVLHNDDPRSWTTRWNLKGSHGVRFLRVLRPLTTRVSLEFFKPHTQLALLLYGCSSEGLQPRKSVEGFTFGWTAYS